MMVHKNIPALRPTTVLHAQWSDLPEDIVEEVRQLWDDMGLGNDFFYMYFMVDEDGPYYPAIADYLTKHGHKEVLIHYWW